MEQKQSIQDWLFLYALTELFHGSRQEMSKQLGTDLRTISRVTLEQNNDAATRLLERLLCYCIRNGISIDAILSKYPFDLQSLSFYG